MGNKDTSIALNDTFMEELKVDFTQCASYVDDIFKDVATMQQTMYDSYNGYALEGVNDFFRVLSQHLDKLKQCYEHLAAYTELTSTELREKDRQIASKLIKEVQKK
ncbi:hypothetical protein [Anaerosporobacter sp.]